MSQVHHERLTRLAGFTVLQQTPRTDRATTGKVDLHAMLATTGNRWRRDENVKARKAEKHVIMKLKRLWHPLMWDVRPSIARAGAKRPAVGSDLANGEGLCVVHGIHLA